jgi:hypothetical protein
MKKGGVDEWKESDSKGGYGIGYMVCEGSLVMMCLESDFRGQVKWPGCL